MRLTKQLSLLLILGILFSCKKFDNLSKISATAWNPNLAIPIGHKSFGVYDILALQDSNDLIIVDPIFGDIALNYSSEIFSVSASDVVAFPSISQSYTMNLIELNVPISASFSGNNNGFKASTLSFPMTNGVELHSVLFKNGQINLELQSNLKHSMNVGITLPGFKLNNIALTQNAQFIYDPQTSQLPLTQTVTFDMAEVVADMTNGGTTVNETSIEFTTVVMGSGEEVTGSEDFEMNLQAENLSFHNIIGYVGQQPIAQIADSVLLKIFQNATEGTFELVNPKIDFQIENSFGFPLDVNLGELKTINVSSGLETHLLNFPTTININSPSQLGETAYTSFELNKNNTSNITTIISPTPKYFYYEVDAEANPNGPTGTPNFVDENSRCVIKTEVNLPLEGLAYGFFIQDTLAFESFENENTEFIDFVMFRLITNNGFPVTFNTQITAVDENYNELFTLFSSPQSLIEAAPVDVNGRVSAKVKKITDATLTNSQILQLKDCRHLIIYGAAETTDAVNGEIVKFYDSYNLDIKLALQIQGQTKL